MRAEDPRTPVAYGVVSLKKSPAARRTTIPRVLFFAIEFRNAV